MRIRYKACQRVSSKIASIGMVFGAQVKFDCYGYCKVMYFLLWDLEPCVEAARNH